MAPKGALSNGWLGFVDHTWTMDSINGASQVHRMWVVCRNVLAIPQDRVIVGRAVLLDGSPVHRFWRKMGIAILSDHVAVPSFRIGVFLLHAGETAKAIL